jgi:hypothetical protein
MPRYNYECPKCKMWDYIKNDSIPLQEEVFVEPEVDDIGDAPFIWEVSYPMGYDKATKTFADPPVIRCPICDSVSVHTMAGTRIGAAYTRGNGFLDKAGVRREMNLHTLKANDPYAHIRPEGDKEEMIKKIEKTGQRAMMHKSRDEKEIDFTNSQIVQKRKQERLENKAK